MDEPAPIGVEDLGDHVVGQVRPPGDRVNAPVMAQEPADQVGRERRVQGEAVERLGQMDGVGHGSLLGSARFALPIIVDGEAVLVARTGPVVQLWVK
jgi:hypothetical protein